MIPLDTLTCCFCTLDRGTSPSHQRLYTQYNCITLIDFYNHFFTYMMSDDFDWTSSGLCQTILKCIIGWGLPFTTDNHLIYYFAYISNVRDITSFMATSSGKTSNDEWRDDVQYSMLTKLTFYPCTCRLEHVMVITLSPTLEPGQWTKHVLNSWETPREILSTAKGDADNCCWNKRLLSMRMARM